MSSCVMAIGKVVLHTGEDSRGVFVQLDKPEALETIHRYTFTRDDVGRRSAREKFNEWARILQGVLGEGV